MNTIESILRENSIKTVESITKRSPKTSVGRELMNNLKERLDRRGNTMIEMKGHYIAGMRLSLSSNFFNPKEKDLHIWVKPFIKNNKLYFNYKGATIRGSDVFGIGINRVRT